MIPPFSHIGRCMVYGCIYNSEGRQYSRRPLTTTGKIEMHKLLIQFDVISIYDKMYFAISSDT